MKSYDNKSSDILDLKCYWFIWYVLDLFFKFYWVLIICVFLDDRKKCNLIFKNLNVYLLNNINVNFVVNVIKIGENVLYLLILYEVI